MKTWLGVVLGAGFLACGGKVAFDGLPGAGGAPSSSSIASASNASHASSVAASTAVSSTAVASSTDVSVVAVSTSTTVAVASSVASTSTGSSGAICDSGLSANPPACNDCLSMNCCGQADACTNHGMSTQPCSDDIMKFEMCFQSCSMDPACLDKCASAAPLSGPLFQCLNKACAALCK